MSRKSPSPVVAPDVSPLADAPLIALPELARREGVTKGVLLNTCRVLRIEPHRTPSNRDHLTFNQVVRLIEHLHRAAQPS